MVIVILTAAIAFFKAVPVIVGFINKFYDLWIKYDIEKLEGKLQARAAERRLIIEAIKNETNIQKKLDLYEQLIALDTD
jgi:hypothetical protein